MTGLEIMEGMSYVDAKFIQEAETAALGRNTPWMKLVSVAACLCILVVGAYAYRQANMKSEAALDLEPAADAPAAGAPLAPAEETGTESQESSLEGYTDELQNIAAASLRIVSFTQEGFTAVVEEESADCALFTVGMQVQVTIDAGKVPDSEESDAQYGGFPLPEEGMLVKIENGAYDASANTLFVVGITLVDQGEEGQP